MVKAAATHGKMRALNNQLAQVAGILDALWPAIDQLKQSAKAASNSKPYRGLTAKCWLSRYRMRPGID